MFCHAALKLLFNTCIDTIKLLFLKYYNDLFSHQNIKTKVEEAF